MRAAHRKKSIHPLYGLALVLILALSGACTVRSPAAVTPVPSPQVVVATPVVVVASTTVPTATTTRIPTRAPAVVAGLSPTPTMCINNLQMVLDLSLEPEEVAPAGSQVEKGWRVQNTGSCTWDTAYRLEFDAPNNPGWINLSPPARLERDVRPGEMVDLWVSALAPLAPGSQQASWKLVTGSGQLVGQPLVMVIETALLATGTAASRVIFTAYPQTVQPGGQVALAWSVRDAKAVYLSTVVQPWQNSPVETTASRYVYPLHTTTYELHIVNGDDSIETARVEVEVENFDPPKITFFDVRPRRPYPGECLQITWETANQVDSVSIFLGDEMLYKGKAAAGVFQTCPAAGVGVVVYTVRVAGPGGEVTRSISIEFP